MLSKLSTLFVLASAVGLGAFGVSQQSEPAQLTPSAPAATQPSPTVAEPPAPAPTATPAPARPAANLQIVRPPVVMGQYTIPYTIHLTITAVSNPQLNYLVGLNAPLNWADTGAWKGEVQLPQGGIEFIFAFLYAQPTKDNLPWCDVCACGGGRDALGAFLPPRCILATRDYRKASSMTPIQIMGRMQGGSIAGGLTTVDYILQP